MLSFHDIGLASSAELTTVAPVVQSMLHHLAMRETISPSLKWETESRVWVSGSDAFAMTRSRWRMRPPLLVVPMTWRVFGEQRSEWQEGERIPTGIRC